MPIKDVLKILKYYKDIDNIINEYIKELKNIELEYYMKNTSTDDIPTKTNRIISITENLALNIPNHVKEYIKYLKEQIKQCEEIKKEIYIKLDELELIEKIIIIEFYIKKYRWQKISKNTHYSIRQCQNIRTNALKKLSKKFNTLRTIARFL